MSITGLDHYDIAAPAALLEQVRHFYCKVLGLKVGHRPAFNSEGYWLYAGDKPLVHLRVVPGAAASLVPMAQNSGWLAHIAFNCCDFATWQQRLEALGVVYSLDIVAELRQVQLFLTDPAGVNVELNFSDAVRR